MQMIKTERGKNYKHGVNNDTTRELMKPSMREREVKKLMKQNRNQMVTSELYKMKKIMFHFVFWMM